MRVCYCVASHPKYQIGGAQLQCYLISKELQKSGVEVHFTSNDFGQRNTEIVEGAVVHKLYNPIKTRFIRALSYRPWRMAVLDSADADIYHQRGAGDLTGEAAFYSKLKERAFVFTPAHIKDCSSETFRGGWIEKQIFKYGLKNADAIVCIADYMRSSIKREQRKKCVTIRSGHPVPEGSFKKASPPSVLWCAQMTNWRDWKRPELFLSIAEELGEMGRFVVVGGMGNSRKGREFRREAMKKGVDFVGELSFEEVNSLLSRASVFVNTSESEGFPNTFIQAWMRETPVVSLNVDPDGVICNEGLGFHSKSFGGMVENVRTLLEDPKLRKEMGRKARRYAMKKHDIKDVGKKHIELYEALLDE